MFKEEVTQYCPMCEEWAEKYKQLEGENEELTGYKYLFEKTRNLWDEARINNYKLLDEIKDLKDSLKRTICQSECYKHKEAEKLKQALQQIRQVVEFAMEEVLTIGQRNATAKILEILQKCEVENV